MSEQQPPSYQPPQQPHGDQRYGGAPQGRPVGDGARPTATDDLSPADQRLWSTLTHLAGIFLYVVAPLVAYLVLRDRGLFVQDQTREALNFQITSVILWAVVGFLSLISFGLLSFLLLLVPLYVAVFSIVAAVKANNGERYRYPLTLRLVR
ncbi:DUF4870 domain-containing protein [uncultured Pseudokineococcus sp.]|uniref:DUF4870 domain-containing protein n=1 Tax=uncultured Pseudokineococcus sp. TaxID=1642928 RepID=UPI00262A30F5|nr:DUF4870 domain-containing protein [uncultured Pseudokineococcus sp.]